MVVGQVWKKGGQARRSEHGNGWLQGKDGIGGFCLSGMNAKESVSAPLLLTSHARLWSFFAGRQDGPLGLDDCQDV